MKKTSGVYVKIHRSGERFVIAVADKDLIGKTVKEKNKKLNISDRFYHGKELPKEQVIEIMRSAHNLNLVGKKTIALAIEANAIHKENIIKIKNVPHAQAYTIDV